MLYHNAENPPDIEKWPDIQSGQISVPTLIMTLLLIVDTFQLFDRQVDPGGSGFRASQNPIQ